mgnify:CR=1 FL=1
MLIDVRTAAAIAERRGFGLAAGTDIDLLFFLDLKPDWRRCVATVAAVAEGQVERFAAGAPVVNSRFEGYADRHAGWFI